MPEATFSPRDVFTHCVQIGVVVRNVDEKIRVLSEVFGIGPFRVLDWPPEGRAGMQVSYYDQPGRFTARMAFAELGAVELELIEPREGPSIWADFLEQHGEGIHHIRFNTFDEGQVIDYLAGHGIQPAQRGLGIRRGTSWVNFDTESRVGFTIEIMQALAGTTGRTPQIVDGKVVE